MEQDNWISAISSLNFWAGVVGSMLATVIFITITYLFRESLSKWKHSKQSREKDEMEFENALSKSSPYAPFAFGAVQARALRYFLIAVFLAYVGDILSRFIFPFEALLYTVSLYYIYQGLRWFNKIEQKSLAILRDRGSGAAY